MSKVKIYDGMTFDMSTGAVLSHGAVTYHDVEDIAMCGGGGGPSEQKSTTGFSEAYKPQIDDMLADASSLYDQGRLGKVAGFTQTGLSAQNQGIRSAGNQTKLENQMMGIASEPVDLSGQRAASLLEAQGALGTSNAMAGQRGGLGGSRQAINQSSIEQGLAANFAGIDQAAQQQQTQNIGQAMAMQGQGANTLGMIGQAQQAQRQAEGDAAYTALAQRIGLFSGVAPKEQTTTKTGGK